MIRRRPLLGLLPGAFLVLLTAVSDRAQAQEVGLAAFFGRWEGSGIAEDPDNLFFSMTARDLDVRIEPQGDGFTITWTTLIRVGDDTANPEIRRREASLTFGPRSAMGFYPALDSGDPLAGGVMSWARLEDRTLTVYQMVMTDGGGYALTRYARTLTAPGMELLFRRDQDGETTRTVRARLVKTED